MPLTRHPIYKNPDRGVTTPQALRDHDRSAGPSAARAGADGCRSDTGTAHVRLSAPSRAPLPEPDRGPGDPQGAEGNRGAGHRSRRPADRTAAGARGHDDESQEAVPVPTPRREEDQKTVRGTVSRSHCRSGRDGTSARGMQADAAGPDAEAVPVAGRRDRHLWRLRQVRPPWSLDQWRPWLALGRDRGLLAQEPVPDRRHRHPGYGGHKRDAAGRIYGRPACIVSDNGTRFTSRAILKRAEQKGHGPARHRPRQAAAERPHRKLQRQPVRRRSYTIT